MLIGIKIGPLSSKDHAEKMNDYTDYFEIYAAPGYEFTELENVDKPIVVHVAHSCEGVNLADPAKTEHNQSALRWAIKQADRYNADKIVIHPGFKENPACSFAVMLQFLKDNRDPRLLIENMPDTSDGFYHYCGSIEEIRQVMTEINIGFCLDFSHAAAYAKKKQLNQLQFFKELLALNPCYFHLTDTLLSEVFDEKYSEKHVHLLEGDLDLSFLKEILPNDAMLTLETPQILDKQIEEIEFLRALK